MAPRWKVVRTDRELEMGRVDDHLRRLGAELVLLPDGTAEDRIAHAVADADLLLMCYARITRRVIEAAPKLRAIVKYGVGIDAIDIDAARERGVPVVNVPAYAEETVAEGAFALLLALAKRFKPIQHAMDGTGWAWPEPRWMASDLAGKTLGLIGVGRIGRAMARMAQAFRMQVLGYDPHPADMPVERCVDLGEMLERCDAVSLHCVLNRETRHLIGAREFAQMKPTAYFVNVARGPIVDEPALIAALQAGRIAGAALDVFEQEPVDPANPLLAMDNVIVTPHSLCWTDECFHNMATTGLASIVDALAGRCPEFVVDRAVLVHPRVRAWLTGGGQ